MEVIRNHLFKFLPVVLAFSFCPSVSDADQSSLLCYIKKRVATQPLVCQNNVSLGNCCQEDQLFIQEVSVHRRPGCNSKEKCDAVCCGTEIIARTPNETDRKVIESVFKTTGCFKETDDVLSKLPYNTGLEAVVITYTCHHSEFKASIGVVVPIVAVVAVMAVVTTVFVVVLMVRRRRTALRDTYPPTREDNHLPINHIHNNVLSYQTPSTVTDRNDIPSYSVVDKIHVNCEHAHTGSDNYTRIYNTINLQQLPVIKNPIYGYGPDRIDSNDSSYYDHVGECAHPQVSESDYYAHIGCPNVGPGGGAADCDMYSHTSGTGTQEDNGTRSR